MPKSETGFPSKAEYDFRQDVLELSKKHGLSPDMLYYNLCFMVAASTIACDSFGMKNTCYNDAMNRIRMYMNFLEEMQDDS